MKSSGLIYELVVTTLNRKPIVLYFNDHKEWEGAKERALLAGLPFRARVIEVRSCEVGVVITMRKALHDDGPLFIAEAEGFPAVRGEAHGPKGAIKNFAKNFKIAFGLYCLPILKGGVE